MLVSRLLTYHNLALYQGLMARLRDAIVEGPDSLNALRATVACWHVPIGKLSGAPETSAAGLTESSAATVQGT